MENKRQTMILSALVAGLAVVGTNASPSRGAPVECGAVVTSNLRLDRDLECAGPGAALVVGADHVTIDLNGHTLRSLDGLGVGVDITGGYDHVTVKNGVIDGFQEAILAQEASHLTLRNLTIPSVSGNGIGTSFGYVAAIHIKGGQKVQIRDSSIAGVPPFVGDNPGPDAISFESVTDVIVRNVHVNDGFSGVSFSSCGDGPSCPPLDQQLPTTGVVKDCSFANSYWGVALINADDVSIQGNVISGTYVGVLAGFLDFLPLGRVNIRENELFENYFAILSFLQPTGPEWAPGPLYDGTIKENWVHDNYQGVALVNGQDCQVSENLVENNYRYGIALHTFSSGNKVSENVVTGSSEFFGIGLTWSLNDESTPGPSGNLIQGNTAVGNSAFDLFHAEFSTPNVWKDNICETSSGADIVCSCHDPSDDDRERKRHRESAE